MTEQANANSIPNVVAQPTLFAEGPVVYVPHEEVSLVDAAVVLVRRWLWVLIGVALGLALAGWWISRSPVRYESRGVVRIGRTRASFPIKPTKEQQDMLLEPVSVASMRIREEYAYGSVLGQKHGGAGVSNTIFDREADELLTILARAPEPQAAQDFLNAVMLDFVEKHKSLFADERAVMEGRLKVIESETRRISSELERLDQLPGGAEQKAPSATPPDSAALVLTQLTRSQFLQQKIALEQEAVRLQRDIFELQSQPTVRISAATLPGAPVEPRTSFLLTVGLILGVIMGCSLAYFVEFAVQVRRRLGRRSEC